MVNLKFLVTLDRWAYPFYAFLSPLFKLSKRQRPESVGDSVILKMLGIGSITRIFTNLRAHHTDLNRICFVTLDSNRQLCDLLEIPNTLYIDSSKWYRIPVSLWRVLRQIRKMKPDYIVDYERSSNLLGIFRGITTLFSDIGTVSFYQLTEDQKHRYDTQFRLKNRSIADLINLTVPYLPRHTNNTSSITSPITDFENNNRVLININASDYLAYRKYPPKAFAQVIIGLLDQLPKLEVLLIGTAGERAYVQAMIDDYLDKSQPIVNCCGDWNLKELVNEMKRAGLLITNDSGPMHLAVANQVKTVVIWGPTTPETFGYPDHPYVVNLHSGRSCAPCFTYPKSKAGEFCNKRIDCMNDIKATKVVEEAVKLLTQYPVTT